MKSITSVLIFLLFQIMLSAQEENSFQSTFELQTAISYVDLLGGKAELLDSDDPGFYNLNLSAYDQSGVKFQLGALANRQLTNALWLRSGFQVYYLKSYAEFDETETYDDATNRYINSSERTLDLAYLGIQVPILLESYRDFGKWKAYGNLGLTISYADVKQKKTQDRINSFDFNYIYDPTCDCFPTGEAFSYENNPYYPDGVIRLSSSFEDRVRQFETAGLLGIGAIIKGKNGRDVRIGYAYAVGLFPFYRGNNKGSDMYEIRRFQEKNQRHSFHQIEFSVLWPEREIILGNDDKQPQLKGWFTSVSTSLQMPIKKKISSGRSGVGWGRNAQLKYISKIGLGGRIQYGKWIAPSSNYATKSTITKAELLYQIPLGVEFSIGYSHRNEIDVDGGGGTFRALNLGTGGIVPLNERMGIAMDFTMHFLPWESNEKILLEPSIGFAYRIVK